jgi:hypothetical protein
LKLFFEVNTRGVLFFKHDRAKLFTRKSRR